MVRDAATGEVLAEVAEAIGTATNNVAEYRGLLAGLRAAAAIDPDALVEVRADSKLVVEQMSGRWQVKHEGIRRLVGEAREILPVSHVRYLWVPRARNTHADRLANEAMDAAAAGRVWSVREVPGTSGVSGVPGTSGVSGVPGGRGLPAAAASTPAGSARAPRPAGGEPTTLLLVRHGRTPLTEAGRFSGRDGDDPALSVAGEHDAERVAELLGTIGGPVAMLPDITPPTVVVASPMRRTRQTADRWPIG